MPDISTLTRMASDLAIDDTAGLSVLLARKLQGIPEHHLPTITINDILQTTQRALHIAIVPPDLQLPFFLRNRSVINRDNVRAIKDERRQPLRITRVVFFYNLSEIHQFQRFHDMSRWNLALFVALVSIPTRSNGSMAPPHSYRNKQSSSSRSEEVSPAARRFMMTYLAAVMEYHNTPTVFDKRDEFVRRWKDSNMDLFVTFKTAQRKLLKKLLQKLNYEWEQELDKAMMSMGRWQYDARVAPFVGSIVHGQKDQRLPANAHTPVRDFTRSASPSPEARYEMDVQLMQGRNELLEALRVPLEDRQYQDDRRYEEEAYPPADVKYAIGALQHARPADMLPALMRLFPVEVKRESRWGSEQPGQHEFERAEYRWKNELPVRSERERRSRDGATAMWCERGNELRP